jgi:hypothetical protein
MMLEALASFPNLVWSVLHRPSSWSKRVHFVAEAHHLAWTQYPVIWLCVCFAILWLVLRSVRSRLVRGGVLMMLCGLMLNALVTDANAGHMPVVGMPAAVRPANATWQAATANTQLAFLADQRQLGLFSLGDLVLLLGGMLILAICARRILKAAFGATHTQPCNPRKKAPLVVRGIEPASYLQRSA